MITLAWYLLKVIICSGILCGYYFLALRNKAFHRWNRFYLLAAFVISLITPIIKIDVFQNNDGKGTVVQMLQTINSGDEAVIEYSKNSGFQLTTENLAGSSYLLISLIFLSIFFVSLIKIQRLRKKYPETKIEDISFINTKAKGTPFSFFKSIFWNDAIDLQTKTGQQIFNHEIAHIKEKHSHDKIFMNLLLIFFWINPFFWLMRKELYMIHEFIADKEALEDSDINAFAEMILQSVYPGQNFSSTNNFFYSPIKRRILMLAKNKNPKVNYISRLLVLPLAAIVFFAFTLKVKNEKSLNLYDGKTITVVIDAGHGGEDFGARYANLDEKDITLDIAKQVKELNGNKNLTIILTRDNDQSISVHDRAQFAAAKKADLFISIHLAAEIKGNTHSGMDILIPGNENKYLEQSRLLGASIIESFKNNYPLKVANELWQSQKGVWVLNKNSCPAILIEAGFFSNEKDRNYLIKTQAQKTIALNILNGIENYTQQNTFLNTRNTMKGITVLKGGEPIKKYDEKEKEGVIEIATKNNIPPNTLIFIDGKESSKDEMKNLPSNNIQSINVLKGETAIKKYGENGKDGVIEISTKNNIPPNILIFIDGKESTRNEFEKIPSDKIASINVLKGESAIQKYGEKGKNGVLEISTKNNIPPNTLIFIDGKESTRNEFEKIPSDKIASINVLKGESAIQKYGTRAKEGAIEIVTKSFDVHSVSKSMDSVPIKIFIKTEKSASFPGGQSAWAKYISKAITDSISSFTEADYGTCVIRFIVNVDGKVSDVEATTMKGTELAKVSIHAIINGPKWIPASQNGNKVAAYRLQPVTLVNPNKNKESTQINNNADDQRIFTKLEQAASFPGGQSAWLRYITRIIDKNANELSANKNNFGTCNVQFIVDKEGTISDVQATNMQGTKLAEVAVNAIKHSPEWIPGKQKGQSVNSFVMQQVSFSLGDQSPEAKGAERKVIKLN